MGGMATQSTTTCKVHTNHTKHNPISWEPKVSKDDDLTSA